MTRGGGLQIATEHEEETGERKDSVEKTVSDDGQGRMSSKNMGRHAAEPVEYVYELT